LWKFANREPDILSCVSHLRDASKALFGNRLRLELIALIAETNEEFHVREVAERLDVADNLIAGQLARLHEVGLLSRRPSDRLVLYTREASAVWTMAKRLRAEFEKDRDPSLASTSTEQWAAPAGSRSVTSDEPANIDIGATGDEHPSEPHTQLDNKTTRRATREEYANRVHRATEVVLHDPPKSLSSTATISELLASTPGLEPPQIEQILVKTGISSDATVLSLSDRQRAHVDVLVYNATRPESQHLALTAREEEVLLMLASHWTLREIAAWLYVSPNTVKTHARHIYAKLDVASRAEAVALVGLRGGAWWT
jgi:DNA-binding CsgD family transcriptional regulator/DNA-binding MarR family transcriptional regulator